MTNILDILFFVIVAVIVLVIASLNKDKHIGSINERSNLPNKSIIDITPIHIKNDLPMIKSDSLKEGNIPAIIEGNTSTRNDKIFENIIDFLNSNDVYFRYGKNKVEKDYQQDLEGRLASYIPHISIMQHTTFKIFNGPVIYFVK